MTELSIGTDGCSPGEPLVHSRNSDRPAVCFLNDDVYIVRVWKNPAGATREQQSPARFLAQRRRMEIPNDWTQNARRGSLDIDHLAKFCR
jgi:hypothetical protein